MVVNFGLKQKSGFMGSVLLLAASAAQAQQPTPPPVTPGAVQDSLKPRIVDLSPQLSPKLEDTRPELQSLAPIPAEKLSSQTLEVSRFEFEGNSTFSSTVLAAELKSYLDRPLKLSQLYEAADHIGAFYRRAGYTLASATIPAQRVNQGSVRLLVIEGRIGAVRYEGLKHYSSATLNGYLPNTAGELYRADQFEPKLRQIDGLPGLDVRARLQPGAAYGTSDVLIMAREDWLQGSVFVDNGGTKNIGEFRTGAQLAINNPLGIADQLSLVGLVSEAALLKYGAATYSLPVGHGGSRFSLTYGYAKFDVSGPFSGLGGSNRNVRGEYSLPLINTRLQKASVSAAVTDVKANTDFSGVTFNRSKVTLAELAGQVSQTHSNRAITQAALVLSSNFQKYDGIADDSSVPLKVDLDLQHLLPLANAFQLLLRGQFVYGTAPLPDTQKFSLGGPATIRSYANSDARGDWGYLGQVVLRRNFAVQSVLLTPRLFYDYGEVRQHRADRFAAGAQPQDIRLAGYGIGTDATYRHFSLKLDYALPTTNAPSGDGKDDGRFYGTFAYLF